MTSSRVENSSSRAARKVKLALMGPAFVAAILTSKGYSRRHKAGGEFGRA